MRSSITLDIEEFDQMVNTIKNLREKLEKSYVIEVLVRCEEYFDNKADADCDQDVFIPSEEMRLLSAVHYALKHLTMTKYVTLQVE